MDELKVNLLSAKDSGGAAYDGGIHAMASPGRSARVRDFTIRGRARGDQSELPLWMYPPDGETRDLGIPSDELSAIRGHLTAPPSHLLGEWPSTAICGNDILASVLYSSGIVATKAGKLMPLTQVLVAVVLYLFRFIYEEAVSAIPLNGGSYNVLLNTTSKRTAAVAATLGIISYLATGVVSGTSALQYLNTQVELPIVSSTVALLFTFALLSIIGIAESASVALVIFALHVVTLTMLSGCSGYYAIMHPHVLLENLKTDFPSVNVAGDLVRGNLLTAVFFGYSSAMLGITGFETSAQFVEEQAPGVFRKTLKNMWFFATIYNVLLSCLSLAVLPLEGPDGIYANRDIVLARMGHVSSGQWLERWVSIDAFVVLSGGVLTSYVGITGLVRRLAYDRVLPAFLTTVNKYRGTNHYIILIFFAVQASLVILLHADASILAGVFTFAFLGVMSLFAFGCMLLKLKREDIPRAVKAPWWSCVFGLVMVLLGLLGNLLGDPAIFTYFALYFIGFAAIMFLMLERVVMLRLALYVLQRLCPSRNRDGRKHLHTGAIGGRTITAALQAIHLPPIVFFCKSPDLTVLNKAILYVRQNEQTHNLRIVHVCADLSSDNAVVTEADEKRREKQRVALQDLHDMVGMFDLMYPKLKIDFVSVSTPDSGSAFDPSIVQWVSQHMGVPTNMMFIRQPGSKAIHQVATLGVRVITG
ncbi:Transmembrane protein [Globisporangium polare]